MPDDKNQVGEPDRNRVAGDQDYEVRHLAEKHGLIEEQARKLIDRFGNDREKLEAAAKTFNAFLAALAFLTLVRGFTLASRTALQPTG